MNSIFEIQPWRDNGVWKFDDPTRNLSAEPFVCGMNEIIDYYAIESGIRLRDFCHARITFSPLPFPNHQSKLVVIGPDESMVGTWYRDSITGLEGWLCPALFKFFPVAPDTLFFRIDGLR